MKKRIMMSALVIALAAAMIAGATQAWFTDQADVPEATFTAGTVLVDAEEAKPTFITGKFDNVNPEDCFKVTWLIKNIGTKNAQVRVKLEKEWESKANEVEGLFEKIKEDTGINFEGIQQLNEHLNDREKMNDEYVVSYLPAKDSGWEIYDEDGEIWLYYVEGPLKGSKYDGEEDLKDEVELPLVVYFNGERMDNRYMNADLKLSGYVEAVQASHDAPIEVWKEAWSKVTEPNYAPDGLAADYQAKVEKTPCWTGENEDDNGDDRDGEIDSYNFNGNGETRNYSEGKHSKKYYTEVTINYNFTNVKDGSFDYSGTKKVTFKVVLDNHPSPIFGTRIEYPEQNITFEDGAASGTFSFVFERGNQEAGYDFVEVTVEKIE